MDDARFYELLGAIEKERPGAVATALHEIRDLARRQQTQRENERTANEEPGADEPSRENDTL